MDALPRTPGRDFLAPPRSDDELRQALALVHDALNEAPPDSPQKQHLAEAQRVLVEMIWRRAVA